MQIKLDQYLQHINLYYHPYTMTEIINGTIKHDINIVDNWI